MMINWPINKMSLIIQKIQHNIQNYKNNDDVIYKGKVSKFDGKIIECDGFPVPIGTICKIESNDDKTVTGEIIGFRDNKNLLAVHNQNANIIAGAIVEVIDSGVNIEVGENLLGRVIDAFGNPIDGKDLIVGNSKWPINGKNINPMNRKPINEPLDVGIKAINSLLTVGRGQRIGIIAGSGVGKSVLLGMMSRFTNADIVVVALIGERGREVGSFVNQIFSDSAQKKTSIVAVPADISPLLRIRGAQRATAIAEYFRSKGKNVLLIMDSLTRIAHAKREVGLALGEQPTSKGYPPSVISMIPALIERTGNGVAEEGSITALYTVLADSDDHNDPVVDSARAILDGHIILSREQSQLGIYPAIDIKNSISRIMDDIVGDEQKKLAKHFKKLVSVYQESRDLVLMGGYTKGQDIAIDEAHEMWPKLVDFIKQDQNFKSNYNDSIKDLKSLIKFRE